MVFRAGLHKICPDRRRNLNSLLIHWESAVFPLFCKILQFFFGKCWYCYKAACRSIRNAFVSERVHWFFDVLWIVQQIFAYNSQIGWVLCEWWRTDNHILIMEKVGWNPWLFEIIWTIQQIVACQGQIMWVWWKRKRARNHSCKEDYEGPDHNRRWVEPRNRSLKPGQSG